MPLRLRRALIATCTVLLSCLPLATRIDALPIPQVPKDPPRVKFDVLMNVDPKALAGSGLTLQQFCPLIDVELSFPNDPNGKTLPSSVEPYYLDPATTGGSEICDAQFASAPTIWHIDIALYLRQKGGPWLFSPAQPSQFAFAGFTTLGQAEAPSPYTGNTFREYNVTAATGGPQPKPTNNHRP